MPSREKKTDFILNFLYAAIVIALCFIFIKYLLEPLLPFLVAFVIVASCRKLILKIQLHSRSKRFASLLFTMSAIILLSAVVYGIFLGLSNELGHLSEYLSDENLTKTAESIKESFSSFAERLSLNGLFSGFSSWLSSAFDGFGKALSEILSRLLPSLISFTVKFISFFPAAVIFLCFMFISMFYISCDYEKICSFFLLQFSDSARETFDETKAIIASTAKELFKSYFLLTFITFFQLLCGFLIIGIDYALICAAIISIVDLLPILGTGTVLVPWAAVSFILDDFPTSAGLIVLYVLITLFRRIAEPRIVGANTGLSPLLSLISIFLGIRLMGISGIIVFPILVITAISLNKKGFIRLYKNFPEKAEDKILKTRLKFLDFKRHDIR